MKVTRTFADGSSITGVRLPDDGVRPLPPGAYLIDKTAEVSVGVTKKMKLTHEEQGQASATVGQLTKRSFGEAANTDKAIPLKALRALAKRTPEVLDEEAAIPSSQEPGEEHDDDIFAGPTVKAVGKAGNTSGKPETPPSKPPRRATESPSSSLPVVSPTSVASSSKSLNDVLNEMEGNMGAEVPEGVVAAGRVAKKGRSAAPGHSVKAVKAVKAPPAAKPVIKPALKLNKSKGVAGGKKAGGVAAILPGVEADWETLLDTFGGFDADTTSETIDQLASSIQSSCTTWGKKKGALLSSKMIDDAETLVSIIGLAGELRTTLAQYNAFIICHTAQTANAFINCMNSLVQKQVLNKYEMFLRGRSPASFSPHPTSHPPHFPPSSFPPFFPPIPLSGALRPAPRPPGP